MRILFPLFIAFLLVSCNKDSEPTLHNCDLALEMSNDLFNNGPTDATTIIRSVHLDESTSCLVIEVQYSGGCQAHNIRLAGRLTEELINDIPVVLIKLIHNNTDPCEALPVETVSYDLSSLNDLEFPQVMLRGDWFGLVTVNL